MGDPRYSPTPLAPGDLAPHPAPTVGIRMEKSLPVYYGVKNPTGKRIPALLRLLRRKPGRGAARRGLMVLPSFLHPFWGGFGGHDPPPWSSPRSGKENLGLSISGERNPRDSGALKGKPLQRLPGFCSDPEPGPAAASPRVFLLAEQTELGTHGNPWKSMEISRAASPRLRRAIVAAIDTSRARSFIWIKTAKNNREKKPKQTQT